MGLDVKVPDFSTLSRCCGRLKVLRQWIPDKTGPVRLVVDSTGLKVSRAGEWQESKHGKRVKRRFWRKPHLGLDLVTGQMAQFKRDPL